MGTKITTIDYIGPCSDCLTSPVEATFCAKSTTSCAKSTTSYAVRFLLALKCHTPTCGILKRSATTPVSTSAKSPRPCFGTSYRHLASRARWCSMRLAGLALLQTQPDNLAVAQFQSSFVRDGADGR